MNKEEILETIQSLRRIYSEAVKKLYMGSAKEIRIEIGHWERKLEESQRKEVKYESNKKI